MKKEATFPADFQHFTVGLSGPTSNVKLPKPLQCFNVYFLTINFPYPRFGEFPSHTEHATTAGDDDDAAAAVDSVAGS